MSTFAQDGCFLDRTALARCRSRPTLKNLTADSRSTPTSARPIGTTGRLHRLCEKFRELVLWVVDRELYGLLNGTCVRRPAPAASTISLPAFLPSGPRRRRNRDSRFGCGKEERRTWSSVRICVLRCPSGSTWERGLRRSASSSLCPPSWGICSTGGLTLRPGLPPVVRFWAWSSA